MYRFSDVSFSISSDRLSIFQVLACSLDILQKIPVYFQVFTCSLDILQTNRRFFIWFIGFTFDRLPLFVFIRELEFLHSVAFSFRMWYFLKLIVLSFQVVCNTGCFLQTIAVHWRFAPNCCTGFTPGLLQVSGRDTPYFSSDQFLSDE